jgi:hypothetical protein
LKKVPILGWLALKKCPKMRPLNYKK